MAERMVQVSESLIKRARDALRSAHPDKWAVYEELHALLSQPTPTGEQMVPVRAVTAVLDGYDNGDGECEPEDRWRLFRDMRSLLASGQVMSPVPNAPPRIEDMAPGTTFRITEDEDEDDEIWTVQDNRVAVCSTHGVGRYLDVFDPFTIRDVTPPKEQP